MDRIASLVADSIGAFEKGDRVSAMMHACIALDATARRHFKRDASQRSDYKALVRDHVWCLHMMMGGGIDLQRTLFTNLQIKGREKIISAPDIADVLYHVFRCPLVHGDSLPCEFELQNSTQGEASFILSDGTLQLPDRIIWGALAICVFAKCNEGLCCGQDYFLTWSPSQGDGPHYRFMIDQNWGNEGGVRSILDSHPPLVLVEMRWQPQSSSNA
ncbi:hypothetical protein [Hyphomicrobium sp.]|jgi:hypothetical protein|uniref:hypothetical protein n=1 Tax=Hyphomicrobium sp. TaxID=82 RepID=UPI0035640DC0